MAVERASRLAVAPALQRDRFSPRPCRHSRAARAVLGLQRGGKRRFCVGDPLSPRGSYVPTRSKAVGAQAKRPQGRGKPHPGLTGAQQKATSIRENVAFALSSGAEGATSLDTEVLTQRVRTEDRHNSTAKRLRILTPRTEWLADVKESTSVVREQSARKLDARGRALARDRLLFGGGVEREDGSGRPVDGPADSSDLELRARKWSAMGAVLPPIGEVDEHGKFVPEDPAEGWTVHSKKQERVRPLMNIRRSVKWHSSRAANKRALFERVADCGKVDATRITLVCRGCKDQIAIEVGCGSSWFCAECRRRSVMKFRKNFERSRLGIVTIAARAGLTKRNQKKGDRWGERLLTVTLPHRGTPAERIETLQATWARFWRTLRNRLRPELQGPSGITLDDVPRGFPKSFEKRANPNELQLFDLLSYLHVFEWTPGKDGKGHPHMHVWLFSRYLDQKMVKRLWEAAHLHVRRAQRDAGGWSGPIEEFDLVVDIRKAGGDVANELVKYLTKDWEVNENGARRAAPEVFAEVYATLDGKRRRQSSAAFSMWAVEKHNVCPCCGFERERGHWARVDIEHALEESKVTEPLGIVSPVGMIWDPDKGRYTLTPLVGVADYELRAEHDAKRDLEWVESFERRIVAAEMRKRLES